jgi:hypothetical protein
MMRHLFPLSPLALVLLLPACDGIGGTATTIEDPVPCQIATYRPFIGGPLGALDPVVVPQPYRVIRPGDAVTRDFIANRLNFFVSEDGRVADITCG